MIAVVPFFLSFIFIYSFGFLPCIHYIFISHAIYSPVRGAGGICSPCLYYTFLTKIVKFRFLVVILKKQLVHTYDKGDYQYSQHFLFLLPWGVYGARLRPGPGQGAAAESRMTSRLISRINTAHRMAEIRFFRFRRADSSCGGATARYSFLIFSY